MKIKNFKKAVFYCIGLFSTILAAQQSPIYSDYAYNPLLLNPAHAGFYDDTEINLTYRNTPLDFEGAPTVLSAVVNATTKSENIGFGFSVLNDRIGVSDITNVSGSFAYKIIFKHHSNRAVWWDYNPNTITFGVSLGVVFYNENLTSLNLVSDPLLSENSNETVPSIGAGFLYNRDQFYLGISSTNLIASTYNNQYNLSIASPNYIYGGYRFFTSIFETYMIKPSFLLKYEKGLAPQLDANIAGNFRNLFEFGFGYRTNKSVNVLASVHASPNLRFLASYNFAVADQLLDKSFGFLISYRFGKRL